MIQTDPWITDPDPDHSKEPSLNQENILSYLAESDGNIRILIATITYEMGVYNQGVKVITIMVLQETLKHTTIRMTGKEETHLCTVDFTLKYCSDN